MRWNHYRAGFWLMLLLNLLLLIEYMWKPEIGNVVVIIFWIQSILLGLETILKILFTPEGEVLNVNGKDTRSSFFLNLFTAGFFTVHFGVFIMVMGALSLVFMKDSSGLKMMKYAYPAFFLIVAGVVIELPRKLRGVRRNSPGVVTLMFAPYIRLVPLAIIMLGSQSMDMKWVFLLFIIGKAVAEWVYFYTVDRQLLQATEKN